eukprot:TRINITY_DN1291_c0_g2_i1.p1 TRINITY_DN1291_c0_g2~~TRINITY_DN1291_c0_g2_i1.p1  ORF type:complete len:954 (+),score=225.97 TRINITY_DN1291_c0_g2_i1:53-2914(+)
MGCGGSVGVRPPGIAAEHTVGSPTRDRVERSEMVAEVRLLRSQVALLQLELAKTRKQAVGLDGETREDSGSQVSLSCLEGMGKQHTADTAGYESCTTHNSPTNKEEHDKDPPEPLPTPGRDELPQPPPSPPTTPRGSAGTPSGAGTAMGAVDIAVDQDSPRPAAADTSSNGVPQSQCPPGPVCPPVGPVQPTPSEPPSVPSRRRTRRRDRDAEPRFGPIPVLPSVLLSLDVVFTGMGGAELYSVRGPPAALEFLRGNGRTGGLSVTVLDSDTRAAFPAAPDEAVFLGIAHPVDGIRHSPGLRALAQAFRRQLHESDDRGSNFVSPETSPARFRAGDALAQMDQPWLRFLCGGGLVWLDEGFQVITLAAFGGPISDDPDGLRLSHEGPLVAQASAPPEGTPAVASPKTSQSAEPELTRMDTMGWLLGGESDEEAVRVPADVGPQQLNFAGPFPLPLFLREAMLTEAGIKLRQPTPLTPRPAPRRRDLKYYAWLPPRTSVVSRPCRHGAVAFIYDDASKDCIWTLVPSQQVRRAAGGAWARRALADRAASQLPSPLTILLHSVAWEAQRRPPSSISVRMSGVRHRSTGEESWVSWPECWGDSSMAVWNTARDLACKTTDAKFLRIELLSKADDAKESRTLAARDVPVGSLCWEEAYTAHLEGAGAGISAHVTLLPIVTPHTLKTVFFVRHGESVWNRAQAQRNVVTMMSSTDHPLNDEGKSQALLLNKRLRAAIEDMRTRHRTGEEGPTSPPPADDDGRAEELLLRAQVVMSSPLTRAIQTALFGLQPVLRRRGRLQLCRNLRERRNFGGRDSSGTATGPEIMDRARKYMSKLCGGDMREVERYMAVNFDTTEVVTKWWVDRKEDDDAFGTRLTEFLRQLQYTQEERIIAVGHSHFFRSLFRAVLNQDAECVGVSAADLRRKKLENCGVAAVTFDFARENPLTRAELILGTGMVS